MKAIFVLLISTLLFACAGNVQTAETGDDDMKGGTVSGILPVLGSAPGSLPNGVDQKIKTRSKDVLSLQTQDLEPADYTVKFAIIIPPLTVNQAKVVARPEALIEASAGGVTTKRRVTIQNGTSVTVVAEKIRVTITDQSYALGIGTTTDYQYDLAVTVGRGSRPSVQQPPIFIPTDTDGDVGEVVVSPGTEVIFPIPDDVGAISVYVTYTALGTIPDGSFTVRQSYQRGSSAGPGFELSQFDPARSPGWVPLAAGCNQIILNNDVSSSVNVLASVFIGIDG